MKKIVAIGRNIEIFFFFIIQARKITLGFYYTILYSFDSSKLTTIFPKKQSMIKSSFFTFTKLTLTNFRNGGQKVKNHKNFTSTWTHGLLWSLIINKINFIVSACWIEIKELLKHFLCINWYHNNFFYLQLMLAIHVLLRKNKRNLLIRMHPTK